MENQVWAFDITIQMQHGIVMADVTEPEVMFLALIVIPAFW